jgi:hypothetical protein
MMKTMTHFFSDPKFSLRDVYCPFKVLCPQLRELASNIARTHKKPFQDSERPFFRGFGIPNCGEKLWSLAPVG